MTSPGPPANPSVAGGVVRHVVTGEITDVDRNSGKVEIRSSDGSKVQVILPVGGSDDEKGRPRLDRRHDWTGALTAGSVTGDRDAVSKARSVPWHRHDDNTAEVDSGVVIE